MEVQADFIFKKLIKNNQAIYDEAIKMLGEINEISKSEAFEKEKIEANIREIDKLKSKIAILVDLCTECYISIEFFRENKKKI